MHPRKGVSAVKSFDFCFDFAGPNGYLVHKILPEFCDRTGAVTNYVPVLLGGLMKATGNRPPWAVYADVPTKLAYDRLEFERFIAANGLTKFKMNPHFPVNTLFIMRVMIAASQRSVAGPYREAMFGAMWEDGLNLADRAVVYGVIDRAGLDADDLLALADTDSVKDQLTANTQNAVARGAFGIPTFFVGDDMFFGKERLEQVAGALATL
jgi:2-hydroxychromene-2-carboxylate isomerase